MRKGNGGDTGRNDEHKGKNVTKVTNISLKKTSLHLCYNRFFIEEKNEGENRLDVKNCVGLAVSCSGSRRVSS